MNNSKDDIVSYLHALGPDAIAEILNEYDILYEKLLAVPTSLWICEDMKSSLERASQISVLEDMIEMYEYVVQPAKRDIVAIWLKLVQN